MFTTDSPRRSYTTYMTYMTYTTYRSYKSYKSYAQAPPKIGPLAPTDFLNQFLFIGSANGDGWNY